MNKLPPEIIDNHILPLLDGTTLTALSSVSSKFRSMIYNKEELWKNICVSAWPFLLPLMKNVVPTYPGGYRSFFSDTFPSLHYSNNNTCQFQSIDLPPIEFVYFVEMNLKGESSPALIMGKFIKDGLNTESEHYCDFQWLLELNGKAKNEEWMDYFQDNLRLNWIVIDGTRKCARSLFDCGSKPVSVKRTWVTIEIMYEKVMPGLCDDYTEMVKCHMKATCSSDLKSRLEVGMKDMNGKSVLVRHANMIFLNAIQNGERKKF